MEKIRRDASAYYRNLPPAEVQQAKAGFRAMDKSGSGKISLKQYSDYFKQRGLVELTYPDLFKALDTNGDGRLDFDEYITVYYLCMNNKLIYCEECGVFLSGSYMSCLQCFNNGSGDPYNICYDCYRGNRNNIDHHKDAIFFDDQKLQCFAVEKVPAVNEGPAVNKGPAYNNNVSTTPSAVNKGPAYNNVSTARSAVNKGPAYNNNVSTTRTAGGKTTTRDKLTAAILGVAVVNLGINTAKFVATTQPELWEKAKHVFDDPQKNASDTAESAVELSEYGSNAVNSVADLSDHGTNIATNTASNFSDHGSTFAEVAPNFSDYGSNIAEVAPNVSDYGSNFAEVATNFSDHGSTFVEHGSNFVEHLGTAAELASNCSVM